MIILMKHDKLKYVPCIATPRNVSRQKERLSKSLISQVYHMMEHGSVHEGRKTSHFINIKQKAFNGIWNMKGFHLFMWSIYNSSDNQSDSK